MKKILSTIAVMLTVTAVVYYFKKHKDCKLKTWTGY